MSFNMDDVNVGGQLKVGTGIYPAIKEGRKRINGSAGIEGPVVIGDPGTFTSNRATLMLAPNTNDDPECFMSRSSFGVSGVQPQVLMTKGNVRIDGDVYVTGSVDCESVGRLEERHSTADRKPKLFDMDHPSTPGMRLAHACIEGPEVSVFYRGRCRNSKEIVFPSYWKDLVHINSISVQLQPVGAHQDIIVKRWDDTKVYLQSKGGMPIDCFYHILYSSLDLH